MNTEFGLVPEDHPVTCGRCPQRMPVALIADHLILVHGVDPAEIRNALVDDRAGRDGAS